MSSNERLSRRAVIRLVAGAAIASIIPVPVVFAAQIPIASDPIGDTLAIVSDHFDVSIADILSSRRTRRTVLARLVAMHLALKHSGATAREVGRRFRRDYTSVLLADRTMLRLANTDPNHARLLLELERRCMEKSH